VGIIGWSMEQPVSKERKVTFPVSKIRGKTKIGEQVLADQLDDQIYTGLIDDLSIYEPDINIETLAPTIVDFYEHTYEYRLFAKVKWQFWFKPFAAGYCLLSRYIQQLNLPLSSKEIEMTGHIVSVEDVVDGRTDTRAWIRKVENETIFIALYAKH